MRHQQHVDLGDNPIPVFGGSGQNRQKHHAANFREELDLIGMALSCLRDRGLDVSEYFAELHTSFHNSRRWQP